MVRRVLILLAIVVVGLLLYRPMQAAHRAAAESPQQAMLSQAQWQLAEYYEKNGHYPESLEGFTFDPEGLDPKTLPPLVYRTDGAYYRIVTKSVFDGSDLSVCH